MLPPATLSKDPAAWEPPAAPQISIVAGKHSVTGMSNSDAEKILGVTPQNFRRYTSVKKGVSNQSISFSAWHCLLNRLGMKIATVELAALPEE